MNTHFLIDLGTALWLGCIGVCIGSFLNVVAYRMPLGLSVVWKPSHCPNCKHSIRVYDNVPVLGWLWLRGRCRDCREPIAPRYAIVEAVMGLAFFALAYTELFSGGANLPGGPITNFSGALEVVWDPQWQIIGIYMYHCTLLSLLMSLVLIGQDKQRIPLSIVLFATAMITTCSIKFPYLYTMADTSDDHLKYLGFVKAVAGALVLSWFSWIVLAVLLVRKTSQKLFNYGASIAIALAITGGFLGIEGTWALLVFWVIASFVIFLKNKSIGAHTYSILIPLWPVTLVFLIFWRLCTKS